MLFCSLYNIFKSNEEQQSSYFCWCLATTLKQITFTLSYIMYCETVSVCIFISLSKIFEYLCLYYIFLVYSTLSIPPTTPIDPSACLLLTGINGATLRQHPKKDCPQGWGAQCHGLCCLMGLWSQLSMQNIITNKGVFFAADNLNCNIFFTGLRSVFSPLLWLLQQPAHHRLAQVPHAPVILPGWCGDSGL